MPKRRMLRWALFAAAIAVLVFSVRFGFAEAWVDRYALSPAALSAELNAFRATTERLPTGDPQASDAAIDTDDALPAAARSVPAADDKAVPPPDVSSQPLATALSDRVTEYNISVSLQEDGRLLGKQAVTWKNPGRKAVSELYFHLYPNAFSPGSTFLTESGGKLRGDKMKPGSYGAMELLSLTNERGETLLPRLRYVQPDDGNRADRTLATLRLPHAVQPGESVTLMLEFAVRLPDVFARMGKAGDFVMAGQWFPKLAVYEPAGVRGRKTEGWNLHQYHGDSEFYADFGIYSVKIDVPQAYTVAATGFQTKPQAVANGRKTLQFYAEDVHDFAWSASPHFAYAEESFSAEGVPGVRIKLYLDPLHKHLTDRYMHAAKSALDKLGEWYGDYPYSTLSIVIPPGAGNGAGGMEYPTLVTGAAAQTDNPGYDLERTLVHEIAHQYWYGMVASNEFEEAWLDEGFTSYAEDKLMTAIYGVVPNVAVEASYMTDPEPLSRLSWKFSSSNGYAENVYLRGKLVLLAMERSVGEKTMNRILRAYFQKYRFKHPTADDFRKVAETVTRTKWTGFFDAYVRKGETADFAVERIETERDGNGGYESRVLLARHGGVAEPVTLWFRFADGQTLHKQWDGVQSSVQLLLQSDSPLVYAAVDPAYRVVLDNRKINNYLQAEPPPGRRAGWSEGLTQLVEILLGTLAW